MIFFLIKLKEPGLREIKTNVQNLLKLELSNAGSKELEVIGHNFSSLLHLEVDIASGLEASGLKFFFDIMICYFNHLS